MKESVRNWMPSDGVWRHEGVRIALGEGIASVPDCANVEYMGFVVMMTPRAFLSLAARKENDSRRRLWLHEQIAAGETIGAPFLNVDLQGDFDPVVKGHDGRSRMGTLAKVLGWSCEVPVCILPRGGMRARHITDEMVQRLRDGAVPEREYRLQRPAVWGPLFGRAFLNGRVLEPGVASAPGPKI